MSKFLTEKYIKKNNSNIAQTSFELGQNENISPSIKSSESPFSDFVIPNDVSLIVKLNGVNAKIIHEEESILTAFKSA